MQIEYYAYKMFSISAGDSRAAGEFDLLGSCSALLLSL